MTFGSSIVISNENSIIGDLKMYFAGLQQQVPPSCSVREHCYCVAALSFSEDGEFLAAACSDGRGMLFDAAGKSLWQRELSKPAQIDNVWINASGRDGFAAEAGVIFTTINTFNRENWQLPTPVEHPSNNSMFVFNYDGTF